MFPPTLDRSSEPHQARSTITTGLAGPASGFARLTAAHLRTAWFRRGKDAAEMLEAARRANGTARKEATPHRPIAPGTYGPPLPPSEPLISGAFFMRC